MMTESVSVTVQSGQPAQPNNTNNQGAASKDGRFLAGLNLNALYFRTIPGILKIAQVVLGIICMATGWNAWFLFVAVAAFIMTIIWCVVYLFSIRESLNLPVNWILTELSNTGIWTILYLTAFIVQLSVGIPRGSAIAAGIFGLFNTLAYAAGTYFLYLEYKN